MVASIFELILFISVALLVLSIIVSVLAEFTSNYKLIEMADNVTKVFIITSIVTVIELCIVLVC